MALSSELGKQEIRNAQNGMGLGMQFYEHPWKSIIVNWLMITYAKCLLNNGNKLLSFPFEIWYHSMQKFTSREFSASEIDVVVCFLRLSSLFRHKFVGQLAFEWKHRQQHLLGCRATLAVECKRAYHFHLFLKSIVYLWRHFIKSIDSKWSIFYFQKENSTLNRVADAATNTSGGRKDANGQKAQQVGRFGILYYDHILYYIMSDYA